MNPWLFVIGAFALIAMSKKPGDLAPGNGGGRPNPPPSTLLDNQFPLPFSTYNTLVKAGILGILRTNALDPTLIILEYHNGGVMDSKGIGYTYPSVGHRYTWDQWVEGLIVKSRALMDRVDLKARNRNNG